MEQQIPASPPPMTEARRQEVERQSQLARYTRSARVGSNNFYWIAGLSVLNSLLYVFGGGLQFVAGLAMTEFVDGFAGALADKYPDLALFGHLAQFVLDAGIVGLFVLFGFFAARKQRWAFIVGMVLYALDAILMLIFQDIIAFAFHLLFLWLLWNGFQALNRLRSLQNQPGVPQTNFPSAIS